jgi:hypothetical protein
MHSWALQMRGELGLLLSVTGRNSRYQRAKAICPWAGGQSPIELAANKIAMKSDPIEDPEENAPEETRGPL